MSELKLKGDPPYKVVTLNRPLVLVASALVAILVLWMIFSAFETPKHSSADSRTPVGPAPSTMVSPLLAQLPKNYQDVSAIKKFLPQQSLSPQVEKELSDLRSQEAGLQAQLSQLHGKPEAPVANSNTPADSPEAIKSDLFFQAGKPPSSLFDESKKTNSNVFPGSATTAYAQQNMQAQKVGFLQDNATQGDIYNHYQMVKPVSPYEVQAGTIVAANLLTAINTSLPGDIIAQVRQNVYDTVSGKYLLIPQGSKLLGKYDSSVAYGQERVLIVFDRIIRPDGTSIQLSNFTGSDSLGEAGFEADVDNHWGKILGAATISSMLSFGAGVAADRSAGSGSSPYYPSTQQTAIAGAAGGVSQTGQALTSRAMDIQPTLTVPAGFNFNVIVNKDMILAPYKHAVL